MPTPDEMKGYREGLEKMADWARKHPGSAGEDVNQSVRYHNRFLFDYCGREIDACIERLRDQASLYLANDARLKRRMRIRALFTAALTLNATAVWTARLLSRGTFAMVTQRRFFMKRFRLDPKEWGPTAKSCFARALSGFSLGPDGVCIDRHLQRMAISPADAVEQWRDWFRLYESLYGPGETVLCVRWHVELLDWIALMGPKPVSWKGEAYDQRGAGEKAGGNSGRDEAVRRTDHRLLQPVLELRPAGDPGG